MLSCTCRGRITYYTEPPEAYTRSSHVSAEIVKEMSAAFDINSLISSEQKALQGIRYAVTVMDVRVLGFCACGILCRIGRCAQN